MGKIFKKMHKLFFYWIRQVLYRILSIYLKQDKIILFVSSKNDRFGNITAVAKKLKEKNVEFELLSEKENQNHPVQFVSLIAQAKVLLIDATPQCLRFPYNKEKTKIIQCWHAGGAYKKVGFDARVLQEKKKNEIQFIRNISYFVCSSKEVARLYEHAFGLTSEKALLFGLPRLDDFVKREHPKPQILTILYAPTFRKYGQEKRYLKSVPKASLIKEHVECHLGCEVRLAYRSHPTTRHLTDLNGWEDWSDLPETEALESTSILITDYSSIFFDFLFLNRPIIFYVPDYKEYIRDERGLYFSPFDAFSETCCDSMESLLEKIVIYSQKSVKYTMLWDKYMGSTKGYSSDQLYSFISKLMEKGQ